MTLLPPPPDPTPSTPGVPAGWHHDPASQRMRWWNGQSWTEHFAPGMPVPYAPVRVAKQTGTAYVLAILLGGFSAHNFYLNRIGPAIGFLALWWIGWALTAIYIGAVMLLAALIWWIVDLVQIPAYVDHANR